MSSVPTTTMMQGESSPPETKHRWHTVNRCKNQSVTVIFQCDWSGERITVPAQAPSETDDTANYYDEATSDDSDLHGYTTLQDAIHGIKGKLPALYLMEEYGSATMKCGSNEIFRSEWETTMLWSLIFDQDEASDKEVEQVRLPDGRDAFVIHIGGEGQQQCEDKPSLVTRCLKRFDTYG